MTRKFDPPAINWMARSHLPRVLEIERASFLRPWTQEEFILNMRHRRCIHKVAERLGQVLGFMVYEVRDEKVSLLNLAVAPEARRQMIGTSLITALVNRTREFGRRSAIECLVSERIDAAHCFLRHMGFTATGVRRGFFQESSDDAYVFNLDIREPAPKVSSRYAQSRLEGLYH